MTRVYANVVADLFHYGHMQFLKKARALGDYLLVRICTDDVLTPYKRRPILTMEERVVSVVGCRYVDEVLPNAPLMVDRALIERVGNQRKWDTLRPERSGVEWGSGELSEDPIVSSSPFDRLRLHLIPAFSPRRSLQNRSVLCCIYEASKMRCTRRTSFFGAASR